MARRLRKKKSTLPKQRGGENMLVDTLSKTTVVMHFYLSTVAFIVLYISALPPKILPQIPKDPGPDPKTQSMLSAASWSRSCLLLLPLLLHVLPRLLPYRMP
jgi:hypothetical protein